ncbi:YraN family protein [Candidatus Woesearchaeota archaeon]|nr:YraN family protein [Candidatus Woesearchaeota archaeon]
MDLKDIERLLSKGKNIEELMDHADWRDFEDLCSQILEEHGWSVRKNYRFKTGAWYEIDLLASRNSMMLLIDCKHWGIRKGKASQLRAAMRKQKQRAEEFRKINFLIEMRGKHSIRPLIITWFQEDITEAEGCFIVPVYKLNDFLLNIEEYL